LLACAVAGCGSTAPPETAPTAPAAPVAAAPIDVPELVVSDLQAGTGAEAQAGSLVTVHYTGWLYDPEAVEAKARSSTARAMQASRSSSGWGGQGDPRLGSGASPG
jgi:hypothetical protein